MRYLAFAYGLTSYALFLGVFLYAAGFVGDLLVPRSIDSPVTDVGWGRAAIQDTLLLLLFAVPHSVMARPSFKAWWTKLVPEPVEHHLRARKQRPVGGALLVVDPDPVGRLGTAGSGTANRRLGIVLGRLGAGADLYVSHQSF